MLNKLDLINLLGIVEAATASGVKQARVVVVLHEKLRLEVENFDKPKETDVSNPPNGD